MRLLVVEDSQRLRETLADGLTAAGYAVDAVADGRAGLVHARATDYDAVILDLMLPEMDGLSVLRALRVDSLSAAIGLRREVELKDGGRLRILLRR